MSAPPRILVTGATGRLGQLLVPRLLARGASVRALTRHAARANELRAQGAETAVADFDDAAALRRALREVSHLFLLSPITPTLAAQQIAVIEAAAAAGVQRIVKLSGSHWTIEPPGRSLSGDAHAEIEAALARTGIAHRVLRPNAWLQVMLARVAAELAAGDVLHAPPGDPRVAFIDARDIADVAVEALFEQNDAPGASPAPWVLTGATAVGYDDIARIASTLTGRTIATTPLSAQAQQQRQAANAPSPYIARVHTQFAELIAAGEAAPVTGTVADVLGRPPRTVEAFLAETVHTTPQREARHARSSANAFAYAEVFVACPRRRRYGAADLSSSAPMSLTAEISQPAAAAPSSTAPAISAATLHQWLQDGRELALLDIREHGQYGEGHPFFAVHAGYSRLETEVARLVPRRATRTVLFDDGDAGSALAQRAAGRLAALGYDDVSVLAGGAPAWARAGHTLFKGVNLPSKTFGEIAEHAFEVQHISARDLAERQRKGEPLVLLDGRTLEEHRKMTLPGAIPVPNGELALRWRTLVPDANTTIVVHCAGRTRSIVGAQILRDLGVPNPVLALENGTQGWALAGLELERGSARALPPAPDAAQRLAAREDSAAAARRAHVPVLTAAEAQAWLDDGTRTTFVFDVRTVEEFAAGGLQGARHAAGGQLLQATDLQVGVRHARVLVLDDDGVRSPVVALWLRRLGLDAALVEDGLAADLRVPVRAPVRLPPAVTAADAETLSAWRDDTDAPPAVLDLRPSPAYRARHARGAVWSIRPRVAADAQAATGGDLQHPVLLIAPDETAARLAAQDLREAGWQHLSWARAEAVESAGWAQQATPASPPDAEAIDYLLFVHDRHDGNLDAARLYLDWELGLIAQCAPEELATFRVPAAAHQSSH